MSCKMDRKGILPTGATPIDRLLEGGLHIGEVTSVFGEAATGKSTLAYQSLINMAKMGLCTIYIDTEHKFNTQRIAQINDENSVIDNETEEIEWQPNSSINRTTAFIANRLRSYSFS